MELLILVLASIGYLAYKVLNESQPVDITICQTDLENQLHLVRFNGKLCYMTFEAYDKHINK